MYTFLKQYNPVFGEGTHGYCSRWMVEFCYVVHTRLKKLEDNDGWKQILEFDRFRTAMKGVSDTAGLDQSGLEYFLKVPQLFFRHFRFFLDKHMLSIWCSKSLLHYMLGGHPELAKSFAQWLCHGWDADEDAVEDTRDDVGTVNNISLIEEEKEDVNNDGMDIDNSAIDEFTFTNKKITLHNHHTMAHGPVEIDTKLAMEWITRLVKVEDIRKGTFVTRNRKWIQELADAKETIDLFDPPTFQSENPHPLALEIWKYNAKHGNHNQDIENCVQVVGNVSMTGAGENRRSARAVIVGNIGFESNRKASMARGNDVNRLQGSRRNAILLKNMSLHLNLQEELKQAKPNEFHELYNNFSTSHNKTSKDEKRDHLDGFTAMDKDRKTHKAEAPVTTEVTALVGGKIKFTTLTQSNDKKYFNNNLATLLDYELRERLVNYQVTDGMKLADRVTLLKEHVKKKYFEDINHQQAGLGLGANTNLPDFVPITAGMQDVIRIQETIQIIKQNAR